MADPRNYDEYMQRFATAQRMSGFGPDVALHSPCPFCAEADFIIVRIAYSEEDLQKDATCKNCNRSAKTVFVRDGNSITFEVVQTGGPAQPEWLPVKMRRVDAEPTRH